MTFSRSWRRPPKSYVAALRKFDVRCYEDLPCVPMYLRLHEGRAISGIMGYFLSEAFLRRRPHQMVQHHERRARELPGILRAQVGTRCVEATRLGDQRSGQPALHFATRLAESQPASSSP